MGPLGCLLRELAEIPDAWLQKTAGSSDISELASLLEYGTEDNLWNLWTLCWYPQWHLCHRRRCHSERSVQQQPEREGCIMTIYNIWWSKAHEHCCVEESVRCGTQGHVIGHSLDAKGVFTCFL
jgi:hypothetical protein